MISSQENDIREQVYSGDKDNPGNNHFHVLSCVEQS